MNKDFWNGTHGECLLNPRLPESEKNRIHESVQPYLEKGWVWLKSSGTESSQRGHKLVALKRDSLLLAAESVNAFLEASASDHFLNPLPNFHVGGLSVSARCFLSGAKYSEWAEWRAEEFVSVCEHRQVTLTSLVPTQVFDLVQAKQKSPQALRAVLVGGGKIDPDLYLRARRLGWPLLPSYGMTETCALMACAPVESLKQEGYPKMELLKHVALVPCGSLYEIQSQALFEGFLFIDENESHWEARPNPFVLDDVLKYEDGFLQVFGRESDLVKIMGETVNLLELERRLSSQWEESCVVVAKPHERKGYELHLIVEGGETQLQLEDLNQHLMPFERIQSLSCIDKIPRTELGKVKKNSLQQFITHVDRA